MPVRTPTDSFFEELAARGDEPMLRRTTGTVRFDLVDGRRVDHHYVAVRKGAIEVTDSAHDADAVLRVDRDTFERFVTGEANAMAAALRGELTVEGDLSLVILLQRLFPGPPSSSRAGTRPDGGAS